MITSLPSDAREFLQYVIAAVDANPDLRGPLLRALLTEEFLEMPVRLGRVEDRLAGVEVRLGRVEDDVGWLRGKAYETDVSRTATSLLNREFGFRRARVVLGNVIAMPRYAEDFHETVAAAADDGIITDEQFQRIFATDVIVHCRRSPEAEPTWVAMEVTARVDADDIHRARRSAEALQTVFGEEALPVVVGERIDPPYATLAQESGVTCINPTE
ncbi:MAG: hypothetical protein OXL37_17045 [Chloroflexota bacterium]|nr:hypothetical protein [Chloroflexota bacterium]MDE2961108.1 hypothetical protein [Chloroflexota bacterium]